MTASAQSVDVLPCEELSPACINQLTERALRSSGELRLLDEQARLARRRQWTNYLAADSFNVIGSLLRLGRNIAGGGDIQQSRLAVRALELRRAETVARQRASIVEQLTALVAARRREALSRNVLESHLARLAILEVSYRSGEGSTEQMLPLWTRTEELRAQIETARAEAETARRKLLELTKANTAR